MKISAHPGRFRLAAASWIAVAATLTAGPPAAVGDSDQDGLTDAEEMALGTLPTVPDSDGDGLLDGWEVKGFAGPDGIEPLPVWGAHPRREDVFVEIDWMADPGGSPQANAIIAYQAAADITRVFRRSQSGIEIHFDLGPRIEKLIPEGMLEPDVDFSAFRSEPDEHKVLPYQDRFPSRPDGSRPGESTLMSLYDVYYEGRYFRPSRRNLFYYVVIAEQRVPQNLGDPDADRNLTYVESFSDTLAQRDGLTNAGVQICMLFRRPQPAVSPEALRFYYSSSLLHELGHAFGLGHGGAKPDLSWDNWNWKPNYPSVMNYQFKECGVDFDFAAQAPVMDFSRGLVQTVLRETKLLEPVGMGRISSEHILACINVERGTEQDPDDSLDWNQDNRISTQYVTRDFNRNGRIDDEALSDHDDWGKFRRDGFDGIGLKAFRGCGSRCSLGADVTRVPGDFNGDRLSDLFLAHGQDAVWAMSNGKRQLAIAPPAAVDPRRWAVRPRAASFAGDFFGLGRDLILVHANDEVAVFDTREGQPVLVWYADALVPSISPGTLDPWQLGHGDRFLPVKLFDSDRHDLAVSNGRDLAVLSSTGTTQEPGSTPRFVRRWGAGSALVEHTAGRPPALRSGRRFASGRRSLLVTTATTLLELLPPAAAGPNPIEGASLQAVTREGRIPAHSPGLDGWEFRDSDCLNAVDLEGDGVEELVLRSPMRLGVVRWNGDGDPFLVWAARGSLEDGAWPLSRDLRGERIFAGQFVAGGGVEVLMSNGLSWVTLGWVPEQARLEILGINNRFIPGLPLVAWELDGSQSILPGRFTAGEADTVVVHGSGGLVLARFEPGAEGGFKIISRADGLVGAWLFDADDVLTAVEIDDDPEQELLARNGSRLGLLEVWPVRTSTFLTAFDPEAMSLGTVPTFRRGDINADGELDVSDVVRVLGYLYLGFETPACLDSADVDDDGSLDLSDPIYMLSFLFSGGKAPPPPGHVIPGIDPTDDRLDCGR